MAYRFDQIVMIVWCKATRDSQAPTFGSSQANKYRVAAR
jgi:hypothetical protein